MLKLSLILSGVLAILKLAGVVSWSWWLITLPLWLPVAIIVNFIAATLAFIALCMASGALRRHRRAGGVEVT